MNRDRRVTICVILLLALFLCLCLLGAWLDPFSGLGGGGTATGGLSWLTPLVGIT